MLRLAIGLLLAFASPAVAYDLSASNFTAITVHPSINDDPVYGYTYPFGHEVIDIGTIGGGAPDGKLDIVVCNVFSRQTMLFSATGSTAVSECHIHFGDGLGGWTRVPLNSTGAGFSENLGCGDLNGDGHPECAIPDNSLGGWKIWTKNGGGWPWGDLRGGWRQSNMLRPYDADVGQWNSADACNDVVIGGYTGGSVIAFMNPCGPLSGPWGNQIVLDNYFSGTIRTTILTNIDSDGRKDVIASSSGGTLGAGALIRALFNPGPAGGPPTLKITIDNSSATAAGAMQGAVCDMEPDGDPDLVMTYGGFLHSDMIPVGQHGVAVYRSSNNGMTWSAREWIASLPYAFDADCGNMDSDAAAEIVVGMHDSGSASDGVGDGVVVLDKSAGGWYTIPLAGMGLPELTATNDVTISCMIAGKRCGVVATADQGNSPYQRAGGSTVLYFDNSAP